MLKIAPSILSADFSRLEAEISRVEKGGADLLHFDVMDGCFVPNITFGPLVLKALRDKTTLPFNVHLMIEKPDNHIRKFVEVGGDIIIVHVEACIHLRRTVENVKQNGVKVGVALNPATSLDSIRDVIDKLDTILIMTVNPGFAGQSFIPTMLHKIREAKTWVEENDLRATIAVDGGINTKTVPSVVKAGAEVLIAGTAIFSQSDVAKAIHVLRTATLME